MKNSFLVPTGSLIKEYLEANGIRQEKFAEYLGISEKHISDLINGKLNLTKDIAFKLEEIIKEVPASYWLNYEKKYREYLISQSSMKRYSKKELKEIAQRFKFSAVFKGLDWDLQKQANEMLEILRIPDFESFDDVYDKLSIDFMEDGGEKEAIAVWLGLARDEIDLQNDDIGEFSSEELKKNLNRLKQIALNSDYEKSIKSARKLLNKCGVNLVICEPINNSKVRGALTTYERKPVIYLSGRFKTHDHIWFALIHEVGHLLLHYNPDENVAIISLEEDLDFSYKEIEANNFARDFFIIEDEYKDYVQRNAITNKTIEQFASEQNILPGILVARLQHDKVIRYDQFEKYKNR
jgi:addiction module HigA family antidote